MWLFSLALLLSLAGCTERTRIGFGVLGTAPSRAPLSGPAPGSCTTTGDCPAGYLCGASRVCYGPVTLPPPVR